MKDAMEQFFQEVGSGPAGSPYQVVTLALGDQDLQSLFSPATVAPKGGVWMTFFNSTAAMIFISFNVKGTTAVATTAANSIDIQPFARRRLWVLPNSLHGRVATTAVGVFAYVSSISGAVRNQALTGT